MSTEDAPLPSAPRVDGPSPHLLLVRAPYYRAVVDGLTDGATRILREAGATFEILDIAGAFELPQAIRLALRGAKSSTASSRWAASSAARPTITNSSAAPRWKG